MCLGKVFGGTDYERSVSLMNKKQNYPFMEKVTGNHSPEVTNDENSHSQRSKGDRVTNSVHDIEAFKEFLLEGNRFNQKSRFEQII